MAAKTKLELTWIGKDIRPRLEPRILIEEPGLSHHAPGRRVGDIFDNLLVVDVIDPGHRKEIYD